MLGCVWLFDHMDCSPPDSSVLGTSQEWVAISHSRGSSWPKDWTASPICTGRQQRAESHLRRQQFLYHRTTWEALKPPSLSNLPLHLECEDFQQGLPFNAISKVLIYYIVICSSIFSLKCKTTYDNILSLLCVYHACKYVCIYVSVCRCTSPSPPLWEPFSAPS